MEMRQLEYLVAVAEEASFTRAAQRVNISQSGVSAQVRQLERDLGATLLERSARTVALTGAGEAAVKHAREVLSAAAAMRQAVGEVTGVISGHLAVGMVTACGVPGLFEALDTFHRAHPGVTITLAEDDSVALTARVRAGTADIALIGTPDPPPAGLSSLTIVRERLVVAGLPGVPGVVPRAGTAAERPSLTLPDLAAARLICMPRGTGVRAVFDEACAARGLKLDVALEASAAATVTDLAARGLGVAVVSESMAALRPGLESRVIADVEARALLALVWRESPSPAAAAFAACCRAAFA
jgi:DNA-binding transcriptional LysR family regulator